MARAVDGRGHGRGVARFVIRCRPESFPGSRIERDDAGSLWPADIHENAAVLDQRRADGAEEALIRAEFLSRIHAPDTLARRKIERLQHSLRAESVNSLAGNRRSGARPIVKSKVIAVIGWIFGDPDALARRGVQAFDDGPALAPMEQNDASPRYDRRAETLTYIDFPDGCRNRLGRRGGIHAITAGSQKLWPILTLCLTPRQKEKHP